MIFVVLDDGTRRMLDKAKVTLTWVEPGEGGEEVERTFTLANVQKLVMMEPTLMCKPGLMGGAGGMPVVGVAFRDASDFAVEIPFPADYIDVMAEGLKEEASRARTLSERSGIIQAKVGAQNPVEGALKLLGGVELTDEVVESLRQRREAAEGAGEAPEPGGASEAPPE